VSRDRGFIEVTVLVLVGLVVIKYLFLGFVYTVSLVVLVPAVVISLLGGRPLPDMRWGEMLLSWVITGGYVALWRPRVPAKFVPAWAADLAGRLLGGESEVMPVAIERAGRKDRLVVPGGPQPLRNQAVEQLMRDLLSYQPADQGWLAQVASSLRDQARAGRVHANLERIVAILEQEKMRLQHLTEINKLSGQLSQAGLAADVEPSGLPWSGSSWSRRHRSSPRRWKSSLG